MDKNLITQQELSEKYDVDQGTVSFALSAAGIFSRGKTEKKHGKNLYPEAAAAQALIDVYKSRLKRAREEADRYQYTIEKIRAIYEEDQEDLVPRFEPEPSYYDEDNGYQADPGWEE